jgi:hypothetical protein
VSAGLPVRERGRPLRALLSTIYVATAVLMIAGAYGHGFLGRKVIDAELARYPIDEGVYTMLYVVWYFVSGCMLLFGIAAIWAWLQARRGEFRPMFVVYLIAVLYVASGLGGLIYRHGDPFHYVFIVLGALLGLCGYAFAREASTVSQVPASKESTA